MLQAFDLELMRLMTPWQPAWLDGVMVVASAAGGAGLVWLVLASAGLATARYRAAAWRVVLTVAVAYAMVDGVAKPIIARPRPSVLPTAPARSVPPLPRTFSFPSGHATSTFGAAVAVARMWPKARLVWWMLAALIGYSRIYLGHHYPLDVLGGALLGIALAFWVLGGRHRATYSSALPRPMPAGLVIRP